MIFRRIKAHIEKENWFAVFMDFCIVVVGVFLGIQIGNWNEAQGDRRAEYAAIERLIAEHTENLAELDTDREGHQGALVATVELLSMIGPEPQLPDDEAQIGRTLFASLYNPTFGPRLGATNSLIASGELNLIDDPDLQVRLTAWPARADDVLEWQVIERTHGEELILGLTYDYVAWPDIEVDIGLSERKSRFDHDFIGLFSSRRFEGLLDNRRYNIRYIIEQIDALEKDTNELVEDLRKRQEQISQ